MIEDYQHMKIQVSEMAKKVRQIALLYKAKCEKFDKLKKFSNNLMNTLQGLNDYSSDEEGEQENKGKKAIVNL